MLPTSPRKIYLASEPVDMRMGFDTLAMMVQSVLHRDPYEGDAFVFVSRRRDRLKVLLWEDSGFWLLCKRLESGTFQNPLRPNKDGTIELTSTQWHIFLDGIVVLKSRNLSRYKQ